jgi:hypothetical protein
MAFVGKAIIHEIKSLQAMPVPRVIEGDPVVTLPQIPISTPPEDEKPVIGSGAILAAGAAAATAGAVAGGLIGGVTRAESAPAESLPRVEERFMDDLERDLFADIEKSEPKLFPKRDEEASDASAETDTETEDAALLTPASEASADTGEGEAAVNNDDDDQDDEGDEPVSQDVIAPTDDAAEAHDADVSEEDHEDLAVEEDAAPVSTPGLIADDDLAALADEAPALAPLETLDIVGAYDSGGTRFTMYSDGSVTALGEGVDRRFPSLDALRAFIDGGMKA